MKTKNYNWLQLWAIKADVQGGWYRLSWIFFCFSPLILFALTVYFLQ